MDKRMRFQIVAKLGAQTVSTITGRADVITHDTFTVNDAQKIIEAEALLEKLTGLRFHIEQLHD